MIESKPLKYLSGMYQQLLIQCPKNFPKFKQLQKDSTIKFYGTINHEHISSKESQFRIKENNVHMLVLNKL